MNLNDFIKMCTTRDWQGLMFFLQSDVLDLSTKVLAAAVIQTHHPDKDVAQKYSLNSCWGKKLSARPVNPYAAALSSSIDLLDLTNAYLIAGSENMNEDKAVMNTISEFVMTNKNQLAQLLKCDEIHPDTKKGILATFPELNITKQQKEAHLKTDFAKQAKQKISFLQASDKVNRDITNVVGLAPSDFHVTFHKPSNMEGVESSEMGSPGDISFRKYIPDALIKSFATTLKLLDISANYYNMTGLYGKNSPRGIQLWLTPEETHKKFSEYATFAKTASKTSSSQDQQRFFKAFDQVKEVKKLVEETHFTNTNNKPKI